MKRRDFIKISGAAAVAAACAPKKGQSSAPAEGPEQMLVRENPHNGDKVSVLGFGCMRWPMIKDADGKDVIDQVAVNEMVDYALAHGVNYFDTSPAYLQGQSEKAAGEALSRHPRDSYFIATKLSNFGDRSTEGSIKMYHESFKQLKTDYFDYYLLHSIGRGGKEAFNRRYVENGMIDFLRKEKEAGRIRNLGFSFHGAQHEFELDKRGIPIIIMEPLLGGRLANVPEGIARQMKQREPDMSIASWAFRFCGTHPRVLCTLSGMTSMDPLMDNIKTFGHFKPLTDEELDFLEQMAVQMKEYPLVNCTDCKYCMPCPWGIDIPGTFLHYNKAITEGTYAQSREQKDYARLKKAYLVSYDRTVASVRQADHCIGCGDCLPRCPQSIAIPRELRRIAQYVEQLKQDTL